MTTASSRRLSRVPQITDVAARAGVSAMTVSRVINGGANVRPATRQAVDLAIAALNYVPNSAAQALARSSQIRIGLLYSNSSANYLSEFLVGGLDRTSRTNVRLIVEKCEAGQHAGEVARRFIASGIDGIILPPPLCDSAAVIDALVETGTPGVAVGTGRAPERLCTVCIDDYRAAHAMTSHIAALGHERIGFILGNADLDASARRYKGYRDALAAVGLPMQDELVIPGCLTYRSGLDAAELLLDLAIPPSAIFACNDDIAAACVAVAHSRALDVPGDLTVCGFNDTALATTIWPELTTIRQPISAMSRAAVDLLLDQIRAGRMSHNAARTRKFFNFTLVPRHSDAAPRKRPQARSSPAKS